jgi:hypothetical protein
MEQRQRFIRKEWGSFVGKTIKEIRPLTQDECMFIGWEFRLEHYATAIVFTDGSAWIPMADEEGNSAGFLACADMEQC